MATTVFDPVAYKQTTREQWQEAAEAWNRWAPTLERWLGPATELMLMPTMGVVTGWTASISISIVKGSPLMKRSVGPSAPISHDASRVPGTPSASSCTTTRSPR